MIQRTLFYLCMLILVLLPLPLGSNRPWALALAEVGIFSVAALCALCWALGRIRFHGQPRALLYSGLLWLLWLLWIGFQVTPLPDGFLGLLPAPRLAHIQALTEAGMADSTGSSLSIAAGVTLQHWLESAAYATLFFMLLILAGGRRDYLRSFLWIVFISAVAQAVYGGVMLMSGLNENLLGPKEAYLTSATGTYVNRNHFAGYLQLGLACALGLSIIYSGAGQGASPLRRLLSKLAQSGSKGMIVSAGVLALAIGLVLSLSRMGNAAAVGGLTVALGLYLLVKLGSGWRRVLPVVIAILLIDLWIVGNWFGLENLKWRYERTDLSTTVRATYYPALEAMTRAYLPAGSGLGTFEVAYPEFATPGTKGRLRHAHNDYLQFAIETGLPGLLILGTLLILSVHHCLVVMRRRRDPVYSGTATATLMAMSCVALHSLTDFNLQIPANAATLTALLAIGWSCNSSRRHQQVHNA